MATSTSLALMLACGLAFAGLAGCVRPDAERGTADEPGDVIAAAAAEAASVGTAPPPTTGSLLVTAVFSDKTPLAGVKLEVGNESRTTGADGTARFDALPEGAHTLLATKAAHRAAQQEVVLRAGAQTTVEIVLAAEDGGQHAHAVGFEAHEDVYTFEGHFDCSATYVIITGDCLILVENVTSTAGAPDPVSGTTSETNIIDFPLDVNWSLLVVDMTWQEPNPPTSDGMTLALEPAEAPADGHAAKYARAQGTSPLHLELTPGVQHDTATEKDMPNPAGGEVLRARAFLRGHAHNAGDAGFLGIGAAQQFDFTLTVRIVYG